MQTISGYNYGAYKLTDYHVNTPNSSVSFLRVNKISEALTPRLIQTFYRSNFTMTRPWLTRLLRQMSLLPPSMPGGDEAQVECSCVVAVPVGALSGSACPVDRCRVESICVFCAPPA